MEKDKEKTLSDMIKLQELFKINHEQLSNLKEDMVFLYKIIISVLNNIQTNLLIKKITNEEYNDNLSGIHKIYEKWNILSKKMLMENVVSEGFFSLKLEISELTIKIKEFSLKSSASEVVDMLALFYGKDWDENVSEDNKKIIKFYSDIFVPTACIIENKTGYLSNIDDKENGYVFFKKIIPKKHNIIEEIHGARMFIYVNGKIMSLLGYFKNDNMNIIRNNDILKSKKSEIDDFLKLEVMTEIFKKKYMQQISLRNLIVLSSSDIVGMVKDAYKQLTNYKSMSLSSLLFLFSNSNFEKQREIMTILILSDFRSASIASLLYEVLMKKDDPSKARQLYLSLHVSIQKLFDVALDDFSKEITKLKDVSESDIPYDKRIAMLNVSDNVKSKAMEKFKSSSQKGPFGVSNGNDQKAQQWLDGFLKIPFGLIKKNSILSFIDDYKVKIDSFMDISKDLNSSFYEKYKDKLPKTDVEIEKFLSKVKSSVLDSDEHKLDNFEEQEKFINRVNKLFDDWSEYKLNRSKYIKGVRNTLDGAVYGNDDGKKQIEGIIGQWMCGKLNGAVLGFQGPPGVGKTTLAKRGLCKCLKDDQGEPRPFAFIPLGGSTNGSSLEGHGYTYIGSTWGKIVDVLMQSKCMNPIIFFDEVDKISRTEHGREITGILTHITDLTQNDSYNDRYFSGIDIDLSKALIIFSYNDASLIDPILRDRITEIKIKPLTTKDKIEIVKGYLIPEISDDMGYSKNDLVIKDEDIVHIIDTYTFEAGVRKLKEKLIEIFRIVNLERIYEDKIKIPYTVSREKIEDILSNKPKITFKKIADKPSIGLVNGLYATSAGVGGLTIVEVIKTHSDTNFSLELTGQQGDVMKESMKCAKTIAWNLLPQNLKSKIQSDWKDNGSWGLHIHTPEASTPKDGPSAGAAITLAIISQLVQIPIKNTVAMTGEIDLNGNVKQIGGLVSKLTGAKKAGVKLALIPKDNLDDLKKMRKDDLSPEDDNFKVELVSDISQVLSKALVEIDVEFI